MDILSGCTRIIGYHTKTKLQDLGIYHTLLALEEGFTTRLVDCAHMFNPDGQTHPQHQIKELCKNHLNL
jgi:hypothetical protein